MDRTILHCDLNNFYASVECLRHPEYANIPMAVSGDPERRHGIILAKNMAAKAYGVKTGEAIWLAQQKCPMLTCVAPHYDDYVHFSEQVFEIYTRYTDRVEPFGPDECWLDVTESLKLFGDGKTIADDIRAVVKKETGLTLSSGVSFNKIFAKLGSDLKKPDATTVITRDNFKNLLYSLPCDEMLMVGAATKRTLAAMNIFTIGALAKSETQLLKDKFGINGLKIQRYARGEDDEPVREYYKHRKVESVGHGITTSRDVATLSDIKVVVYFLSEMIGARLRKYGYRAHKLSVDLRDNLLSHRTRQGALPYATNCDSDIAEASFSLIKANYAEGSDLPIRTITISTFDLESTDGGAQISMFETRQTERRRNLDRSIDAIRKRFGKDSVTRGLMMGVGFVYDKTDSEDFLPFKR